eukprot:TRINITY_DN6842_c0_g1_i6.p1 TRINITY_DN6842_c0_g1~~TRINITY_DN6842_c0_g1_i6.p1  ORF type:complete len:2107 (+),score=310.40 TRINITY_DN6842_c0_g1_i6:43-6363(+)
MYSLAEVNLKGLQLPRLPANLIDPSIRAADLSFNQFSSIPEEVLHSKELTFLSVSHNCIEILPDLAFKDMAIVHLDLSGNRISTLPSSFGLLSTLQHLELASNSFQCMPPEITSLSSLTFLSLGREGIGGNNISTLPSLLTALCNLAVFSIDENPISSVPMEYSSFSSLRKISMNSTSISDPERLIWSAYFSKESTLSFNNMGISSVPDVFVILSRLVSVSLSGNRITAFPELLTDAPQLQSIDLSQNLISTLPDELTKLSSLRTLQLASNKFKDIPSVLFQMKQLSKLGIEDNLLPPELGSLLEYYDIVRRHLELSKVAPGLIQRIPPDFPELLSLSLPSHYAADAASEEWGFPTTLQSLSLSGCDFDSLEKIMANCELLTSLFILDAPIETLPTTISGCSNLQMLTVKNCLINTLPIHVTKLNSLALLDFSNNLMESLPLDLTQCEALDKVCLDGNPLHPDYLLLVNAYTFKDQKLHLSGKSLKTLTECITSFYRITSLDISHNNLVVLPHYISHLVDLVELDLSCNKLTALPSTIGALLHLKRLDLSENPINILSEVALSSVSNRSHENSDSDDSSTYYCSLPPEFCALVLEELKLPSGRSCPRHFTHSFISTIKESFESPLEKPLKMLQHLKTVRGCDEDLVQKYEEYAIKKVVEMEEQSKEKNETLRVSSDIIYQAIQADALEFLSHPLVTNEVRDIWTGETSLDHISRIDPETGTTKKYADLLQAYMESILNQLPAFLVSPVAKFATSAITFLGFVILTVIMLVILNQSDRNSRYYVGSALKAHYDPGELKTDQDFWNYMSSSFIEQLVHGPKVPVDLIDDYQADLYGQSYYRPLFPARMRQLRVDDVACADLRPRRDSSRPSDLRCTPPFVEKHESRRSYGPAKEFTWTSAQKLSRMVVMGASGVLYPGGGFVEMLDGNTTRMESHIRNLEQTGWIDMKTRVVFIEFIVVCDNVDSVIEVSLMFEFLASGNLIYTVSALPTTKHMYSFEVDIFWIILGVLGIYSVGFLLVELQRYRNSSEKYIFTLWSVLDVLISFNVIAIISIQSFIATENYEMELSEQNAQVPDYYGVSYYTDIQRSLFACLCFLSWFRILYFLNIHPPFGLMLRIIGAMANEMIQFLILLSMIILSFGTAFYALYGPMISEFSTFRSVLYSVGLFLFGEFNFSEIEVENPVLGPIVFFLFMFLCVILLINFLVAILSSTYDAIQANARKQYNKIFAVIVLKTMDEPAPAPLNLVAPVYSFFIETWVTTMWNHRYPVQAFLLSMARDRAWCWEGIQDPDALLKLSNNGYFLEFRPDFHDYNDVYGGIWLTFFIDYAIMQVTLILMLLVQVPLAFISFLLAVLSRRAVPSRKASELLLDDQHHVSELDASKSVSRAKKYLVHIYKAIVFFLILASLPAWAIMFFIRYLLIIYKKWRVQEVKISFPVENCKRSEDSSLFTCLTGSAILRPDLKLGIGTIGYFEVELVHTLDVVVGVLSDKTSRSMSSVDDYIAFNVKTKELVSSNDMEIISFNQNIYYSGKIGCGFDEENNEVYFKTSHSKFLRIRLPESIKFNIPYIQLGPNATVRVNYGKHWFSCSPPGHYVVRYKNSFCEATKGYARTSEQRDIVHAVEKDSRKIPFTPYLCLAESPFLLQKGGDFFFEIQVLNFGTEGKFAIGLTPKPASKFALPDSDPRTIGCYVQKIDNRIMATLDESTFMNALDEGVSLPLTDKFFRLTFLVDMNQGQAYLFMSNEIIFEFVFDKSMVRPRMHPYVLLCSYDQVFRLEPEPKSVGFASTLNVNQERARANTLDSRVDDTHSNITRDQPTEKDDGFGIKLRSSICLPSHVPTVTRHAPKGMEWKKPLWEELGAPTESLFFDDDNTRLLSSGSLNRIIEYLSSKPLDGYVMADENVFTFTFSVVARQELVMERLIDRYSLSEDHGLSPQDLADIRSKTIHLISMTISRSNLLDDPAVRNMVESFAGALEIKQHTSSSKIIRYLLCDYASRKKSSNPIISLISVQAGDEKITTPSQFMKRDVFKVAECVTEIDYQSFQALTATDILDQYKISRKNRQSTKVLHRITERYSQFKNWIRLIIKETSGPRLVETVSFFTSLSIVRIIS